MSATPSTHPQAAVLQGRLAKVIAPATHSPNVRTIVELLCNYREIGWVKGEERVEYVQRLHDALHNGGRWSTSLRRRIRKITYDDLLGAFGAGPWEPT